MSSLPEPIGRTVHPKTQKTLSWEWRCMNFDIEATADAIRASFDFEGRLGPVDLFWAADPEHVEELAYTLLAAITRARELKAG